MVCTNTICYTAPNRGGRKIELDFTEKPRSGGEADVYKTNFKGYVAKIYKTNPLDIEKIEKLKLMVANPPKDPTLTQNHVSIAWIKDLLYDSSGTCLGFLMPIIDEAEEIFNVYNPSTRKSKAPGFNWYYLHATALNTALIFDEIHAKNYVIGDVNQKNILVKRNGMVSIIDTDSFQVKDPRTQKIYRCCCSTPGFAPPELIGKELRKVTQDVYHDRFRLAVIIYLLLTGSHPFHGRWTGNGSEPTEDEKIKNGYWVGGQNSPIEPSPHTIPLTVFHLKIKQLFIQCFNDGHTDPSKRPSAKDWRDVLEIAVKQLHKCSINSNHFYNKTYGHCYWCERSKNLGVDIFGTSPKPNPRPNPNPSPNVKPNPVPIQIQNPNPIPYVKPIPAPIKVQNKSTFAPLKLITGFISLIVYCIRNIVLYPGAFFYYNILQSNIILGLIKIIKKVLRSSLFALLPFALFLGLVAYIAKAGIDFQQQIVREIEGANREAKEAKQRAEEAKQEADKAKQREEFVRQYREEERQLERQANREVEKTKRREEEEKRKAQTRRLEEYDLKNGLYNDGFLGASLLELTPELRDIINRRYEEGFTKKQSDVLKVRVSEGVLLGWISPNSKASSVGLRNGDIIISIDGERVKKIGDVTRFYGRQVRPLPVKIMRGSETVVKKIRFDTY